MAKYRKVDPKIWNDKKFSCFTDKGKLLFLFLLTHPHMTPIGAMRATQEGLAAELKWPLKAFREAFREPLSKGMVVVNEKACFVSLPKFLKYNPPESPNVVKSWVRCLDDIPECPQKMMLLRDVKAFLKALPEGFLKALPIDFAKAMPNQEQEQEQEQDIKNNVPNGTLSREPGEQDIPPSGNGNGKSPKKEPPPYKEIIEYLNEKTGKSYDHKLPEYQKIIRARWNHGKTVEDFKWVIDLKVSKWMRDPKMADFLRPQTLFGTKFDTYLNEQPRYDGIDEWVRIKEAQCG